MGLNSINRRMLTDTMLELLPEEYMVRFTTKWVTRTKTWGDKKDYLSRDKVVADIIEVETGQVVATSQAIYARHALSAAICELKDKIKAGLVKEGLTL